MVFFFYKVKSWLRISMNMSTIWSVVRGLASRRRNLVSRMRRVSLGLIVYLIWEERNNGVFEDKCKLIDDVFRRFQVLLYMILYFHEANHFLLPVG
jgi:hypothetical protein